LCVYHELFGANWALSASDCRQFYNGASLCTHQQLKTACGNSGNSITLITNSWIQDRIDDDNALFVNNNECNNFDGSSAVTNVKTGKYCCLEIPRVFST
jgi:hypothetical protein